MMNFAMGMGGSGGSGGDQDPNGSRKGKRIYHRHTPYQIAQLEAFFKECPHPDENQRRHLGRELGLEPRQIKFWFQNKRTQTKTQNERADNNVLRVENERMHCENLAFREALKNMACSSCGGPPYGEEEHQHHLSKLQQENVQLKQEFERVSSLLARYLGKPISELDPTAPVLGSPLALSPRNPLNLGIGSAGVDMNNGSPLSATDDEILPILIGEVTDVEKEMMFDAARTAMDELIKILRINEPLWIRSSADEQYVLSQDNYERISPRVSHFRGSNAHEEATKDSRVVCMNAMQLVDMFLDPEKWLNIFPTIVTKAQTIDVLDIGSLDNRSGTMLVMYEEMHILSPLVPPREFCFIRYCLQLEVGVWAIADVSFDTLRDNAPVSHVWKFPSGFMIHEMPNGFSKVTWVEHVEVDDKIQTHRLYRELISGDFAYGAQRWVLTLHRMCERFKYALDENIPQEEARGVITLPHGRRSIMNLAHRMVKDFSRVLNMSGKMDFPHSSEATNSGVRVSVRKNTVIGQPTGMIVTAATSFLLPIPHQTVFDFFKDETKRIQWDILSLGNPAHEIAHISNGSNPGNCISVIRPFIPTEFNVLILQETITDESGSMVVYAPVDVPVINLAARGEDTSRVPILPSGIVISRAKANPAAGEASSSNGSRPEGSLVTVAFQILVCSSSAMRQFNMETVATVNTLISSTVQKMKVALKATAD